MRVKFEQAGMSVCGRLLDCQVQQKVQKTGHARVRQKICGRVKVLERGAWRGRTFRGPVHPSSGRASVWSTSMVFRMTIVMGI